MRFDRKEDISRLPEEFSEAFEELPQNSIAR